MTAKKTILRAALCILAIALCLSVGAYAAEPETVKVSGRWKKGDTKQLTLRITSEKNMATSKSREGLTNQITLKVLEASKDGSVIEWRYGKVTVDTGGDPLAKMIFELSEGTRVVYKTAADGSFEDLVNWEEMRDVASVALDKAANSPGMNPQVKELLGQFKSMYSTKEGLLTTIPEISAYHYVHGAEFPVEGALSADTQYGNPLGGDPLPAKMVLQMTEFDPKKNYCKIAITQETDRETGSRLFIERVKKNIEESGQEAPKDSELEGLQMFITESYEHDIDLSGGWATRVVFKKDVVSGPAGSTDVYEITSK